MRLRFRKFVALFAVLLIILSAFLTFLPLLMEEHVRGGSLNNAMSNGASYYYVYNTPLMKYAINNSSTLPVASTGIIGAQISGSKMIVSITNIVSYLGLKFNSTRHYTFPLNSNFSETLLNTNSQSAGTFLKVGYGLFGTNEGKSRFPISSDYSGNNNTLKHYSKIEGVTIPSSIKVVNFNASSILPWPSNYVRFASEYQYDTGGSGHLLVRMFVSGMSGFLEQIFSDSYHNYSVKGVYRFQMNLFATNVAIGPLDYSHYLGSYLVLASMMDVIGIVYLYLLRVRIKVKVKERHVNSRRQK